VLPHLADTKFAVWTAAKISLVAQFAPLNAHSCASSDPKLIADLSNVSL
jgi:hypothetical protein